MIALTLVGEDYLFINPMHIVAIVSNEDEETEIMCVDQTMFVVKESPLTIMNLINNRIN
jgi:hypothetical protein